MRAILFIGWRLQRFEMCAVILIAGGMAALAVYQVLRLMDVAPSAECLRQYVTGGGEVPGGCLSPSEYFARHNDVVANVLGTTFILPLVVGLVPGSTLIAGEIERGSAQLSWTLAASRTRWLFERLVPLVVVVVLASGISAATGESLAQATRPWLEPRSSFEEFGARGPLAVLRAITFAMVALLVGALVGRQLPALVIAFVVCLGLLLALAVMRPFGEPLVPIQTESPGGDLHVTARYRAADGSLLTYREAVDRIGPQDGPSGFIPEGFEYVGIGVPGERLAAVEWRESLLLIVISGIAVAATVILLQRRRPY